MRVLLITPFYPPLGGGAATYSAMITQHFQHHADLERLVVLTEQAKDAPRIEQNGPVTIARCLAPRDSRPMLHPVARKLTSLSGLLQVAMHVQRLQLDLIHWHGSAIIRAREIFARHMRLRPILLDIRDTLVPKARVAGCDHYIASSGNTLEYLREAHIPATKISYIPIPFVVPELPSDAEVQNVRGRYNLGAGSAYVLFVGDLSEQKGVAELLEGFELLKRDRPRPLTLVFVGPDRTGGRLATRIRACDSACHVGRVPRNDVLTLMRGAACVILPARGEALPRVMLEAIALRVPVVCPPQVPEFVRHCPDFVLNDVSPHAIARKVAEVVALEKRATYPFELHAPQHTMRQLLATYRRTARQ